MKRINSNTVVICYAIITVKNKILGLLLCPILKSTDAAIADKYADAANSLSQSEINSAKIKFKKLIEKESI
jgi:hypothetical protein